MHPAARQPLPRSPFPFEFDLRRISMPSDTTEGHALSGMAPQGGQMVRRHRLSTRIWHWLNAFTILIMLMSGLFTPINSMPEWAQAITIANPLKYFIQVTRMVYLKGSGFDDLIMQFIALLFMAIMLNGWAVFSYKKNS